MTPEFFGVKLNAYSTKTIEAMNFKFDAHFSFRILSLSLKYFRKGAWSASRDLQI